MRFHSFPLIGLTALALGCGGGQTGDLSGNSGEGTNTGGNHCKANEQELAFDEVSPLGFSAEQVLEFAERSFSAPLLWLEPGAEDWWESVEPESGESSIQIDVTRGAKAYYVTYEYQPPSSGAEGPGLALGCPEPELGIDVHVDVTTDGGGLSESLDGKLRAGSAAFARLTLPLDADELGGAFRVSGFSDPRAELVQLALNVSLMPEGTTGSLSGTVQVQDGAVTGAGRAQFAVWPGSAACAAYGDGDGIPVAPDAPVLGASGEEAFALIAGTTPAGVTWRDGSSAELTLTVTPRGDGCVRTGFNGLSEPGSAVFPARFELKSDDGHVDGAYLGDVTLVAGEGGLDAHARVAQSFTLQELAETGFGSVVVPSTTERLSVWLEVVSRGGEATSFVKLNGLTDPPCVTTPPPPEPPDSRGGGGSPGCTGTMVTVLEEAAW